jgi:hypothetical protein
MGPEVDICIGDRKHFFFQAEEEMRGVLKVIDSDYKKYVLDAATADISREPFDGSFHLEVFMAFDRHGAEGVKDYHPSNAPVDMSVQPDSDSAEVATAIVDNGGKFDLARTNIRSRARAGAQV